MTLTILISLVTVQMDLFCHSYRLFANATLRSGLLEYPRLTDLQTSSNVSLWPETIPWPLPEFEISWSQMNRLLRNWVTYRDHMPVDFLVGIRWPVRETSPVFLKNITGCTLRFDRTHLKEATSTWPDMHSFWRFESNSMRHRLCRDMDSIHWIHGQ